MEQDGSWRSARKSVDKSLLKNIIRHTDAHNKIQEQNEMWKQWELKKQSQDRNQSYKYDAHARGYMRSDIGLSSDAKKESLKWNRLLLEYEETRNDRWGHSGYKELYPDEFQQENSSAIESDESETKKQVNVKNEDSKRIKNKKKDKKTASKKSRRVGSDTSEGDVGRTRKKARMNYKTKELDSDASARKNRERDGKLEQKNDLKTKRLQSKKLRKTTSECAESDVETGRKIKSSKSKVFENDFRTSNRERDRKVVLDKDSKTKCLQRKEKTESRYTENSFDRKRKLRIGNHWKNDRQGRKRRSESSGESIDRENKDHTSRKSRRTAKTDCSLKKKVKH